MTPTHPIIERGSAVLMKLLSLYTHLRAHETPEHLVCRLLLEKKKKKKNEEFEEEGLAFRIKVPTQEEINDWRQRDQNEYRQEPGGKN